MYSRNTPRNSRRRSGSRATRVSLIAAGACIPVLVVAYVVTTHGGRAVSAANVSSPGSDNGVGGWGRGGYTMMPGPAGWTPADGQDATPAQGQGSSATATPAANAAAMSSANWSGYAAAGNPGTFTNVSASWTQPTATCGATNTFSSFWVGLDGDGTNTVEQTGTEADCNNGTAAYSGWWEMFPNAPVFYQNPVAPGDAMSASVVANGGGSFTLTLADATQNWQQVTTQTSNTAQLGSAEVIAEAPSDGMVLPLSNFGTVNFTNATADNQPIGNENASSLTMVSNAGVTLATPSALTGANAFTVTWDNSGSGTATAAPAATVPATMGGTPAAMATSPTSTATPLTSTATSPALTGTPTPTATATAAAAAAVTVPGKHHHHQLGG
jgi:Peptidase A4 family